MSILSFCKLASLAGSAAILSATMNDPKRSADIDNSQILAG
jgi:hypothetical protein